MKDYFLRAPTQTQLKAELINAGILTNNENVLDTGSYSLLIIGEIWKPTGIFNEITDSEGNILKVEQKVKLDGCHANLRLIDTDLPEILQPFVIFPQNPMFGWL